MTLLLIVLGWILLSVLLGPIVGRFCGLNDRRDDGGK